MQGLIITLAVVVVIFMFYVAYKFNEQASFNRETDRRIALRALDQDFNYLHEAFNRHIRNDVAEGQRGMLLLNALCDFLEIEYKFTESKASWGVVVSGRDKVRTKPTRSRR